LPESKDSDKFVPQPAKKILSIAKNFQALRQGANLDALVVI